MKTHCPARNRKQCEIQMTGTDLHVYMCSTYQWPRIWKGEGREVGREVKNVYYRGGGGRGRGGEHKCKDLWPCGKKGGSKTKHPILHDVMGVRVQWETFHHQSYWLSKIAAHTPLHTE